MVKNQSLKTLISKEEIKAYLENISDYLFKKYIEKQIPARYQGNQCRIKRIDF